MNHSISLFGLITSLLMPWLLGGVWTYYLLRKSGSWNIFIILGHGYLAGLFLTTLIIRGWDFLGAPLNYWGFVIVIVSFSAAGVIAIRSQTATPRHRSPSTSLAHWQAVSISLIILLIVYRYATLTQELFLRPLFPWDAWMNWAPKAIVWYHNKSLVPYTSPNIWLNTTENTLAYTLGNWSAWKYPATVPLIQLWSMLGAKTSDHTLIYIPWLMVSLSLGLTIYGHLRLRGTSTLTATLACYFLLNLPYFNVHTTLAGYADIWLATAFGLATLALHEWQKSRHWSYGFLAIFFAIACAQLKTPGIVLGAIIAIVFLASLIKLSRSLTVVICSLAVITLAHILLFGIDVDIPKIGQVSISTSVIELPKLGRFELSFHPIHKAFFTALYTMLSWSEIWYLLVLMLIIKLAKHDFSQATSPGLISLFLASIFVVFVFYFTKKYVSAMNLTSINRAILYLIPSFIFYVFNNLRFQSMHSKNHLEP